MPKFPFTNYHELNLDWILKKVTALFDASEENAKTIRTYETRLTAAEQTATNAETAATSAETLASAAAMNADEALSVAGTADAKADSALTAATDAVGTVAGAMTAAMEAQQTAGAAVATANDAAATASSLESLANTANQNATAALETAQTADQKAVAAQQTAQTADQKAVAAQSAAATNAGNISILQTNVTDLNRQISESITPAIEEIETALDGKAPAIYETVSGDIASFADGADGMPIKKLMVNIEPVQEGSGDPSPDNIRPISGWTGAEVTRTGKNLCKTILTDTTKHGLNFTVADDGTITVDGKATATFNIIISDEILLKAGTTYVLSNATGGASGTTALSLTTSDGTHLATAFGSPSAEAIYTPDSDVYVSVRLRYWYNVELTNKKFYPMVEVGSTASAFQPYTGNQLSITFPTEAGTVYGGTLDVTNGVLTVDRASVTIDGVNNTLRNNGHTNITTRAIFMANSPAKAYGQDNFISDKFHYTIVADIVGKVHGRLATTGVEFYLPPDIPDTVAGVNAWFADNPTQLCYHLATPVTYQLTPQQLDTLLGTNNIWADVGTVDVEYPADTKLYIDGKIAELQALVLEN